MPHISLVTTSDLPENAHIPDILQALVDELCRHETIDPAAVKAYHSMRSNWVVGAGHPAGVAHCEVSILRGRPLDLRRAISEGMASVLREAFAESLSAGDVGLTLEVREMDPETFVKAHRPQP